MIILKVSIESLVPEMRKQLQGEPMRQLLEQTGRDAVAQFRRNIVTEGKSSGTFAPLSGWNQGGRTLAKARQKERKAGTREAKGAARDKHTSKHGVSRHAGYARQKERDKAEGKIPYGPEQKGARTGGMLAALVGVCSMTADAARVEIKAEGRTDDGASYQTVLESFTYGIPGQQPARDATVNLAQVEARFQNRVVDLVGAGNIKSAQ